MSARQPGTGVTTTTPLQPATRKKAETTVKAIDQARKRAERLATVTRQELEETAARYARSPSTMLAGIVGGVIGSVGGVALSTVISTTVLVSGPLGLAAGAAIAVLGFRGRKYWRLELSTQKIRGALEVLRTELENLPPGVPPAVVTALWDDYKVLLHEYAKIAKESLYG